jgi:FkbM family methyltransferase
MMKRVVEVILASIAYGCQNVLRRVLYGIGVPRWFGSLRKHLIGPFGRAVLTESENGVLLVPVGDAFVGRALCFKGYYDRAILQFLFAQCSEESEVLVVGAHVGAFAIPLAKKVRKVVAVEANPKTYDLLGLNALLNGLQNIELHNFAAGDRTADVSFVLTNTNTGGSRVKMGELDRRSHFNERPQTVTVQMRRLDDVFPMSTFDLIVMDVEGSEALALGGMQSLLGRSRALVVEIVEQHLRRIAKVSNEQFLSLITPHFDEAIILPEGARQNRLISPSSYPKCAFGELMTACCNRDVVANVLFRRTSASHSPATGSSSDLLFSNPDVVESR